MDIYVSRQPIFDRSQTVIGYELLYRPGLTDSHHGTDGTEACLAVILNTFLFPGERIVAPPGKVFIKVTRELLLNGVAKTLPSQPTVLEILEGIEPDEELLDVCREVKEAGYTLALDDYTIGNELQAPLLDLADIVKVDFMKNTREDSGALFQKLANSHRKLLAEKVETPDDFTTAITMGYAFFQGSFFSKPVIVHGWDIPRYKRNYMKILRELSRKELDLHILERIIKQDVTLCYALLKYINSAYFGLRDEVTSLLRAVVLLGETEVRRWASLVLFTLMGTDKPPEVVVRSLTRARMCELLAEDVGLKGSECDLFLMGLFSMLDVLIGRPLDEILEGLNLTKGVTEALLGKESRYRDLYDLVVTYESGEWEQCFQHMSKLNLTTKRITTTYFKAVRWTDETSRAGSDQSKRGDAP